MPPYDMESSSSLIMSVIQILSRSKDDAERDVIRKKLEDLLEASDQKLTKLVSEHYKDLRSVMITFTKTASNLQMSLAKLQQAKQRLTDSRDRLTTKLDELQKLSEELQNSEKMVAYFDQMNTSAANESQDQIADRDNSGQNNQFESTLMENNVFNPRASENSTPALFKFSRSSYAICFEEHFKELSI